MFVVGCRTHEAGDGNTREQIIMELKMLCLGGVVLGVVGCLWLVRLRVGVGEHGLIRGLRHGVCPD